MKKQLLPLLLLMLYFSPLLRRPARRLWLILLLVGGGAGGEVLAQYPSQNISLLSHWDKPSTIAEPIYNIRYNSVWGWVDPQDNKEYAILGSTDGTYFIDVTVPTSPVVRDYVAGRRDSCIWREYKTYQKYLYAVSDDATNGVNQNSMQIIDMSYLPDSVHVVYDLDTLARRTHSLFIDELNATLYLNSTFLPNYGGHSNMAVVSLANPVAPVLLRRFEQDYPSSAGNVHDCYVRNDTCYASSSYEGLKIYKLNPSNSLSLIGSIDNYEPVNTYNHSSALTANSKILVFADEVPENIALRTLDVSNLSNLTVLDTFRPTPGDSTTPHNPFIRNGDNNRVIVAHYQAGVQIFDISNPSSVVRTGFFDTAPLDCPTCNNENYSGCWGAYVDLPSGIILASDMQAGLFVLNADSALLNIHPAAVNENSIDVYPNPFNDDFQISFSLVAGKKITCELTDINGKLILNRATDMPAGNSSLTISGKELSAGSYLLRLAGEDISLTKKLIKTNK